MTNALNIGFYLAPGAETKDTYTDKLLVDECNRRGHNSSVFDRFTFLDDQAYGLMSNSDCLALTDLDLLILRKEDMNETDWNDMERLSTVRNLPPAVNTAKFILGANKKYMKHFSEFTPETYFTTDLNEGIDMVYHFGKTILKPIQGRSGQGIELVDTKEKSKEEVREIVDSMLTEYDEIVVQNYVPGVVRGDKRVLVLGDEAIGAFLRLPKEGSYKCNIYAGGTSHPTEVSEEERELIKAIGPKVVSDGGIVTGYDFMHKNVTGNEIVLTEINGTSVGGVYQANKFLKPGEEPLEKRIIDYVERLVNE